jgi:hypothetical protein
MFGLIFASPDFGAGAVAAFGLFFLSIPVAIIATMLILVGFCQCTRQVCRGQALALATLFATFATVLAGCGFGFREDWWSLLPPILGVGAGIAVGIVFTIPLRDEQSENGTK